MAVFIWEGFVVLVMVVFIALGLHGQKKLEEREGKEKKKDTE